VGVNEKGSYVSPLGLTDHRNVPLGVPVATTTYLLNFSLGVCTDLACLQSLSIQRSIFAFRNYIFTNRNL